MTDKIKIKADKFVNDKKLKLNYIKPKDLKLLLAEFCEEQIAELKAECDLAIEGRDVKIKELEAQNLQLLKEWREMDKAKQKAELKVAELMGDVSTLEQDYKMLEAQIEKMKSCVNCRYCIDEKCPWQPKGCGMKHWELRR